MPGNAILTDSMRIYNATNFYESLANEDATFYVFIGRIASWSNESEPPTTTSTPATNNYYHYVDMIGGKKIAASDVSHVVRKWEWTDNTAYDCYDDADTSLFSKQFYVVTPDNNVYKCIDNNGGADSTEQPTGTGTTIITTADDYKWKYIGTISTSDMQTFGTANWMPVKYLTADDTSAQWDVQEAAISGTIEKIAVVSEGSGYSTATITIIGDGTGATADAVISSGEIVGYDITSVGSGYTRASVQITGDGTGATARVILPPYGGHGKNMVEELGAFYVMLTTSLEFDEGGDLPVVNDYRVIGILKDPYNRGTETVATADTFNQTTCFTLTSITGTFNVDEVVIAAGSDATARVVWWDNTNDKLYVNGLNMPFTVSESISTSSGDGTISVITQPDFADGSGQVMYIDQRSPITRADDQIETLRIITEH